jgi:hypothetical protein
VDDDSEIGSTNFAAQDEEIQAGPVCIKKLSL